MPILLISELFRFLMKMIHMSQYKAFVLINSQVLYHASLEPLNKFQFIRWISSFYYVLMLHWRRHNPMTYSHGEGICQHSMSKNIIISCQRSVLLHHFRLSSVLFSCVKCFRSSYFLKSTRLLVFLFSFVAGFLLRITSCKI